MPWNVIGSVLRGRLFTWRRHDMETFSELLPLCEGNPPVITGNGLAPNRRQAIIWANENLFNTHIILQAISLTSDDAKTFDELTNSWTKWSLFCRFIAIPLYKISVNFTRFLDPRERTSMKFKLKCKYFLSRKFTWKCRLQNGDHVVSASVCYYRYVPSTSFGSV